MVVVVPPPPTLSPEAVSAFYVVDELLARSPLLIFYGPSATPTATSNNSRIQAHVFSPAGLQSYPRLTISPSSPLYSAVNCLPREEQGDEICRGLAFSLFKYFGELPQAVKYVWENMPTAIGRLRSAPALFSDAHAAMLASKMIQVQNVKEVIKDVRQALAEQTVSWLDVDVVLPAGSMKELETAGRDSILPDPSEEDIAIARYGKYATLVKLFGEPAFLPTSRLRRQPSKPTVLNRGTTFLKKQKENIRREMCELLDTEESYVNKLYDLVHSVAEDFRQKANNKSASSTSPSAEALKGLFPPSLDKILETNSGFLEELRRVIEDTENEAIQDIESTGEEGTAMPNVPTRMDVTGTLALATCLRAWFPKFADCYVDYMQVHSQMSSFLRVFMKETGSSFSKRMQETGEQRLMSMLIEPVQRLPRYNLYIDNIAKQLPGRHPALKSLLKARDVISEICSQDKVTTSQPSRVIDYLRRTIPSWPMTFCPIGRLITAIDVVELPPPYRPDLQDPRCIPSILLLFTDFIVILKKANKTSTTARGLMAQIDGVDVPPIDGLGDDLSFRQALEICTFEMTVMDSGKMLQLVPLKEESRPPSSAHTPGSSRPTSLTGDPAVQVLYLTGPNEGKASRFLEDLVKARVEGRFSETERESHKWEARCANSLDLTVFSALFEQKEPVPERRGPPARIRVLVDSRTSGLSIKNPLDGVDVAASVSIVGEGFYRLEVVGPNDYSTKDRLTAMEFLPVLTKRIGNILQMRSQIRNPALAAILLLRNQHILQSLRIVTDYNMETASHGRSSKPHSPVKILKNLFDGGMSKEYASFRKPLGSSASADFPQLLPTPQSRPSSNDGPSKAVVGVSSAQDAIERLTRLEETMLSYILAIHARKGNIVGKVLRARQSADELAVNDLYNSLLEDPSKHQLAAEVPVDVLFAAFEKFVKIAWHDKMGPIISRQAYRNIQLKLDTAGDFDDVFRAAFCDMAPQNQRAFRDMIKLLVDLLDGTSNDSDRGMLTISFAELLVPEGNPHEFVSILDRLVEDSDPLLSEQALSEQHMPRSSMTLDSRSRATNTGSLTSNTSLRKKFGFGTLTRKSSKIQSEGDPEGNSVWRTLSKSKHGGDSQPASMSKVTLSRSNSTDAGDYRISPKRPVSRDRPTVLGAFGLEQQPSPFLLSTIGENPVTGPPRKKRRSSVSDMRSLQASAGNTPTFMSPKTPTAEGFDTSKLKESPRTPSPTKQSMIPAPSPSTPMLAHVTLRGTSPARHDNSPQRALPRPLSVTKQPGSPRKSDQVITTSSAPTPRRRKDSTASGIPKLAPGLSERPSAGNARKLPPTPGSPQKNPSLEKATGIPAPPSPQKLKMQSPAKLRERLANEQKAIQNADAALQAELSKIGDEIAKLSKGKAGSPQPLQRGQNGPSSSSASVAAGGNAVKALEGRLATLSKQHTDMMGALTSRLDNLASDIASSLQVSESRSRKLDDLYREANAENEALYAKFNEELARVLGRVKTGQAEEEGKLRMKVMEEEAEKLRRENGRLRREVVGLRAQLRE